MRILSLLFLSVLSSNAFAQNSIEFTAEATTGVETVTPVLTWDTQPRATSCVASGDWSGVKGGAGQEALDPIISGATYNLSCEWRSDTATLSWTPPDTNTDGSPLTDLVGYRIYYGQNSGDYDEGFEIDSPTVTTWLLEGLAPGTWYFVSTPVNANGIEGAVSNEASKTLGSDVVEDTIGVVVNPRPSPIADLVAQ